MKLYVWITCSLIAASPMCNAKAISDADVGFKFSKNRQGHEEKNGLTHLTIDTNRGDELSCNLNLGFTFSGCGEKNARECATITGTTQCTYKIRGGQSIPFTQAINWTLGPNDAQSNPTTTPAYNIAGCSIYVDPHHLNSCLQRELKDSLYLSVTGHSSEITFKGNITGCALCKSE